MLALLWWDVVCGTAGGKADRLEVHQHITAVCERNSNWNKKVKRTNDVVGSVIRATLTDL